jgi:hypothetical protein
MSNFQLLKNFYESDHLQREAIKNKQEKRVKLTEELIKSVKEEVNMRNLLKQRKMLHDILSETDDLVQRQGILNAIIIKEDNRT